ncbi:DNA topoisomerase 2-like isoform X2 [Cyprinus carpio]|nr:DNA topoisomerase 2-like isoform X2 [Cyprinus carpio]
MAATEGPLNSLFENKALSKPKKDEKRLSVERIYHQKTQLEYILLRPDTYIGSVEHVTQAQSLENRPPSPSNQSRRSSSPVLLRRESLNLTWSSSMRKWLQERKESAKVFVDWTKSTKQKRSVIEDDEFFNPEPSGAPDSDVDSPPPPPVVMQRAGMMMKAFSWKRI